MSTDDETPPTADDVQRAIVEPVHLAPYDPAWPARFAAARQQLLDRFAADLPTIEHIGSTAVPGLSAKPVIDLLAAVPSMAAADAVLPRLCGAGWLTSAAYNATLPARRWLMRQAGGHRTHHLHLVVAGSPEWLDPIRFRDRLRADPALAAAYVGLKRQSVDRLGHDRDAYTNSKTAFVARALAGG